MCRQNFITIKNEVNNLAFQK